VIKRVFRLTLRAAQGFIYSIFALMGVPLRCPEYLQLSGLPESCVTLAYSRRHHSFHTGVHVSIRQFMFNRTIFREIL
jgi:hypothetical protein